ncbi:MAG: hypothetical protein WCW31_06080 [Patescibacteria group bacterium]|jgi:hypothetical protein
MGDPDGTVIPAKAGIQKKYIMALALATGLLVLLGAGCNQAAEPVTQTRQPNTTQATTAADGTTISTSVNVFDSMRMARACNLTVDQAEALSSLPRDLSKLKDVLAEKSKEGWVLTQLCLDEDVWAAGERDPLSTVYFSMSLPVQHEAVNGATSVMKSIIGIWVLRDQDSKIYLSSPVVIENKVGGVNGFSILDLEKHYNGAGTVIPTVYARIVLSSETESIRQTYAFGPGDTNPRKTFTCTQSHVNDQIVSDTCKNKID